MSDPVRTVTAVDSHAHVFTRGLPLAPGRRYAPDYDAPLAVYLALLDENAVSHAVLVQPSFLGTDNSFLLAALAAHPDRLRGVAVVEPDISDAELQLLADQGVCGIRLNLLGVPIPDLRSGAWPHLLERVRALDLHVELHLGMDEIERAGQPVLDAGCKLVIDHFGRPQGACDAGRQWLMNAAKIPRTWVKLSAAYRNWSSPHDKRAVAAAHRLVDAFGPERLVWGSDWPHTQHRDVADYSQCLAALANWIPDAATRQTILADSPRLLFNFPAGDSHD